MPRKLSLSVGTLRRPKRGRTWKHGKLLGMRRPSACRNPGGARACGRMVVACRTAALEAKLAEEGLTDAQREELVKAHREMERQVMRTARKRVSAADFESLAVIGRGAFGEVGGAGVGPQGIRA